MAEPEQEKKTAFESKTIWGLVIMLASIGLRRFFNIEIGEEDQLVIAENLGLTVGSLLVIYGRIKAKGPLTGI